MQNFFNLFFVWASWARNGSFEVFFEKKELGPLGIRPWICVFLILILILILFRWIRKQWMCLLFWFSEIWFLLFLWKCKLLPLYTIFSVPISIWEIFAPCFTTQVGLQFCTICPNISTNINVNFHTPGNHLISYNSMEDQIFIPWAGRKKSLLFSNIMISQMMKTQKLKF
jgi:hypothetical protein